MPAAVASEPKPLTERQATVLKFIFDMVEEQGYQPTIREIMVHMGTTSPNAPVGHLRALDKKGWVLFRPKLGGAGAMGRAIKLLRCPDGRPFEGFVPWHPNPGESK